MVSYLKIPRSLSDIEVHIGHPMADAHIREYYIWRFGMLRDQTPTYTVRGGYDD